MQNESQYSVREMHTEDVIISSRDIDSNYEPSIEEIKQYGAFLGMDPENDQKFLYIAKKGLKAPIPAPWKACQTKDGQIYYFNFQTGESQWEHPCDEEYRKEFKLAKALVEEKTNQARAIENNLVNGEILSLQVNPLEISDISALLPNQSEEGQKNGFDDSIISALNYSHRSNQQRQLNNDEQASQEGARKKSMDQLKNKPRNNDYEFNELKVEEEKRDVVKDKQLLKIEAEFEKKLKDLEKELSGRCEQTISAYNRVVEEKLESVLDQEERSRLSNEFSNQSINNEQERTKTIEQEIDEIKIHEALLLNQNLDSLHYNYMLTMEIEKNSLQSQIIEAERAKATIQTGSCQDKRQELLEEYEKNLNRIEADQQMRLEREINQLKLKLLAAYAERKSVKEEITTDSFGGVQMHNLQREYAENLKQEKHKLCLIYQEARKNIQNEYNHNCSVSEKYLLEKMKDLEEERIQYFKQVRTTKETINNQLQRNYEVQKLSFENLSAESINALKKDIKIKVKDLRAKEELFNILNKLNDEGKRLQRELIEKENQNYELMMGLKELEMALKEYTQQINQYQAKLDGSQFSINNRNQLLQKMSEVHIQLERIGKEIKENEKEKIVNQALVIKSNGDVAKQNLDKLLRKVEGIKNVITIKQERRRSTTPSQYIYENSMEKRACLQDVEMDEVLPVQNICERSGEMLTFQDKGKRWRSCDKKQVELRSSKTQYYNEPSTGFSKKLKNDQSNWYSIFETGEEKAIRHNRSDIWSGLEMEKFSHDTDELYPQKDKGYTGFKNTLKDKKMTSYLHKDRLYSSFERYKTKTTDDEVMFTPKKEIENSTNANQSFLDRQSDWVSAHGPALGLRDQNIRKTLNYKNQTNLYGRQSLQNTSEIINRLASPNEFSFSIKNTYNMRSTMKSFEKKEPSRYLNLKHKIRDEKLFQQYDTLIKKYSSGY